MSRPLGVDDTPNGEFPIALGGGPVNRVGRLRDWWYRKWNFSFGRGHHLEVELEEEDIRRMEAIGWVRLKDGEYYSTRAFTAYLKTWN